MSHTDTCAADGHIDTAPVREQAHRPAAPSPTAGRVRRAVAFLRLPGVRWAALSLAFLLLALLAGAVGLPAPVQWVLYALCYAAGGWEPALAGLTELRNRRLDVDLLMIAGGLAAAAIGQVLDGALLIVIFATSGALEAVATARTQASVRSLLDLAPEQATRLRPDGGPDAEEVVAVADLAPGDLVLVRPGERIGADGAVVDGASDVDQASITGEPLPVAKTPGAEVFAGTVNGTGALRVRVTRPAAESVVARIVALVEQASETKARRQLFIEKVEQRYSVGVVVATLAVFAVPLALGDDFASALLRSITLLVVASPCAVVLATMPPLLSAIANAGRHGVLVKSAVAMEHLADVDAAALDKTGTLTVGQPVVVAVRPLPGGPCTGDELLALAASAEAGSEHPLGQAIVTAAHDRGLRLQPATGFRAEVGRGVTATVAGFTVTVTAPAEHAEPAALAAMVDGEQAQGRTAVVVALDGRPAGLLALADRLRAEAPAAMAALRAATGREPLLLTGDNPRAAAALAASVGLGDVRAGLLPEDKAATITDLQAGGRTVLFAGDGINDAPALAAAGVGAAMGGVGSDLAVSSADVVVVRDDLAALPALIELSRRARRVVVQNLVFAAAVIIALTAVDLFATLPLPLGVLGHEGSTVLVGLNGLRLLSPRAWRAPFLAATTPAPAPEPARAV